MRKSIDQCREAHEPLVDLHTYYPALIKAMREHDVQIDFVADECCSMTDNMRKYVGVGSFIAYADGTNHESNMDRIDAVIAVLASEDGCFDWFNVDYEEEGFSWMTF